MAHARVEISGSFRVSIIAFAGKWITPVPPICLSLSCNSIEPSLRSPACLVLSNVASTRWSDTRLLHHDVYLSSLRIANDIRDNLSSFVECETRTRFADARRDVCKSFCWYVITWMSSVYVRLTRIGTWYAIFDRVFGTWYNWHWHKVDF